MEKQKIILVPGTVQRLSNYGDFTGLDIWLEKDLKIPTDTECLIGHSLGVNFILNSEIAPDRKYIFINPLVKKRNLAVLFVRWMKFQLLEGLGGKEIVPFKYWRHVLKQELLLLKVDVLAQLKKIPKENIFIIHGRHDKFYCDEEDVEILRKNNFKVIETEAGHDWNERIAKEVNKIINTL